MSLDYEKKYYSKSIKLIAGCDEAGRGCLLGPVVAAAVILPKDFSSDLINDSKKLTEKKREEAYKIIVENAVAFGVGIVDADTIDEINIYEASRKAMIEALHNMNHDFDFVLTDCMPLMGTNYPHEAIIKGDAKAQCIAAASIIAKVTRDHIMYELDKKYPNYQIAKHKGYGTKIHLEALKRYGPIDHIHRKTYGPVADCYIEKVSLF